MMTPLEFRDAVIADILTQMNGEPDGESPEWTRDDAENCVGDVSDMQEQGMTPRQAANEILWIAAQN